MEELNGWWFSYFMYDASGAPPERLRQLLAVNDAGLVRFAGGDLRVAGDDAVGSFVGRSASHPDAIRASAHVDARITPASLARTCDRLLRALRDRGAVREEIVSDSTGWTQATGKVLVAGTDLRVVSASGAPHPRLHAVGGFTSRPAAAAFARPHTNAPAFRQNDTVARSILRSLAP